MGAAGIASSSSAVLSVNRIAPGRPSDTISLKLTTNISSSRLLDRTKVRAAAVTSASFGRMVVLWSTTSPTVTGISSFSEEPDALRYAVLVNLKILLAQIRDKAALPVGHRSVQHHQGNIHRDPERSRVAILSCRRRLISGVARQGNQKKERESDRFRHAALSRLATAASS